MTGLIRKSLSCKCVGVGHDNGAFNCVLQFADITRPRITFQPVHGFRRDRAYQSYDIFLRSDSNSVAPAMGYLQHVRTAEEHGFQLY